jgi:catechol 2,3-dioxygenase-like lactoylglutathione lyase family enzyme
MFFEREMKMSHAKWRWLGEDHITYAVWNIESWRAVYVDCFGFHEIHHTADASVHGSSSIELYGLESGTSRIALVIPINRSSVSHIEHFLRKHGDHSVQHVAYGIQGLEAFVSEMKDKGFRFLGDIKYRIDSFGPIKQIFAKRFDANMTPAQGPFYEFVERPKRAKKGITDFFSSAVAGEFYEDVERDAADDDGEPFKILNKGIISNMKKEE